MISGDKETKICKKCGRKLPLDKFKSSHDYIWCLCKKCFNEGMREKRYQQKLSDGLEIYHKDKSMKLQRKYKKPYHFQILYRSESSINTIAKDEVFVRLFDYKSVWTSNYGRIIQKLDDGTYSVSMNVLNKKMDIGIFDSEEEAHTGFIDGKIDYICDLAEKCKGKVPDYVYEGMLNYKIEIN